MLLLNKIKVIEIIHTSNAISYKDGELVFKNAKTLFTPDTMVEINFSGIKLATAAFLTALIGRLLIFLPREKFKLHVGFTDVDWRIKPLLDMVISRTEEFSTDPKGFKEMAEKVIYEP